MRKVLIALLVLSSLQVSAKHKCRHRHNKSCPHHLGVVAKTPGKSSEK